MTFKFTYMVSISVGFVLILSTSVQARKVYTFDDTVATETAHDINIQVVDDRAVYEVTRSFTFSKLGAQRVAIVLDLPGKAVIKDFRIRNGTGWITGKLKGINAEAERIEQRKKRKPNRIKPGEVYATFSQQYPVTLGEGVVRLDFGQKTSSVTFSYTLNAPGTPGLGRIRFGYPAPTNLDKWVSPSVVGISPRADIRLNGVPVTTPVVLKRPLEERETYYKKGVGLSVAGYNEHSLRGLVHKNDYFLSFPYSQPSKNFVQAKYGVVRIKSGKKNVIDIAKLKLDTFSLGEIPQSPVVVFVFDASKSMGQFFHHQWAAAAAFLSYVPDAKVTVVMYRRSAERLFDGFISPAQFGERMTELQRSGKFVLGNGSALDLGIELAGKILASVDGPGYMIAFTDQLLRPSFNYRAPQKWLGKTPKNIISHLVHPRYMKNGETCSVDNRLVDIAAKRGGILMPWNGNSVQNLYTLRDSVKELVVPTKIDRLKISEKGGRTPFSLPNRLGEEESLRMTGRFKRGAPQTLEMTGNIWSKPFKMTIVQDAKTRNELLTDSLREDMWQDRANGIRLGKKMHLATPNLFFVAATSARTIPWNKGNDYFEFEESSGGGRGTDRGLGKGRKINSPRQKKYEKAIENELRAIREKCRLTDSHRITVITTLDEVVDVVVNSQQKFITAPQLSCAVSQAWKLQLPKSFDWNHYQFQL